MGYSGLADSLTIALAGRTSSKFAALGILAALGLADLEAAHLRVASH